MEALRYSLIAPSAATVLMAYGCAHAMKESVRIRYGVKDDKGKMLLPHPYAPWTKVDPKYQDAADRAYRAFKTLENVKEWAFMSLPIMWVFALTGGGLPGMTEEIMDGIVVFSGGLYSLATAWYIQGYTESVAKRLRGHKLRRKVTEFWLFASIASVAWGGLSKYGVVAKK